MVRCPARCTLTHRRDQHNNDETYQLSSGHRRAHMRLARSYIQFTSHMALAYVCVCVCVSKNGVCQTHLLHYQRRVHAWQGRNASGGTWNIRLYVLRVPHIRSGCSEDMRVPLAVMPPENKTARVCERERETA